jgi:DNA-binding CsgD family transcriptional regulator
VTESTAGAKARRRDPGGIGRLRDEGLNLEAFRPEALRRLRDVLSIDAAFLATVDPATMLFTSALAEAPLAAATPQFLDNEFGDADVNKFADLAARPDPIGSLDRATAGERHTSSRYRKVLAPLGLGDELRVALRADGCCWGVLCLHRETAQRGFETAEIDLVRSLASRLAVGLRRSISLYDTGPAQPTNAGPGIIILDTDLTVVSINPRAETLLADLQAVDWPAQLDLPAPIFAAAARATGSHEGLPAEPAWTRLRHGRGGWITVHASRLKGAPSTQVAVVLDAAEPGHVSSLVLAAHGLTPAQNRVAALVLQGRSTRAIVDELHISANTLQEHLHAVFDKFGIGSRRELVAALSGRPHHP